MGVKVNYNNNKKLNKWKTIGIIVLVFFALVVLVKSIKNVKEDITTPALNETGTQIHYSVQEYNDLEAIFKKYDCKYISKEETSDAVKINLRFKYNLYTGTTSNESYFLNMSKVLAEFLKFKDFELVDKEKDIDIKVVCKNTSIIDFVINGDRNYYANHDSDYNVQKQRAEATRFTIQSKELQSLIDNDWTENKVNWGTKESTCDKYQIYFDEGVKYKVVARSIFNVVFTSKYTGQVAGGLTTKSSPEAVISALGRPTLIEDENLYGYLGEKNYLFFDFLNNEISVYPVVNLSDSEVEKLTSLMEKLNEDLDVKSFASELTKSWIDYDEYDFDANYVDLRYTLKGVALNISSSSLQNGLYIYQNYSGNKSILDLENVYMEGEDFVVQSESERAANEYVSRNFEGDFDEDSEEVKALGKLFKANLTGENNSGVKFYSITEEYPDSELDRTVEIKDFYWYDDENFVYTVEDDGIYAYNAITRENVKLSEP